METFQGGEGGGLLSCQGLRRTNYFVCIQALRVWHQDGQLKENNDDPDGIEWRLQPIYLQHQLWGKSGCYWFYQAVRTLYNWFICASIERDSSKNTPSFRADSEEAISQRPSSWYWPASALTLSVWKRAQFYYGSLKFICFHAVAHFVYVRCHIPNEVGKV